MSKVIILRSVSGAGKTYVAETIKALNPDNTVICCADDYHMVDGEYKFDVKKLGWAHNQCFDKFARALEGGKAEVVIVANTNTSAKEFRRYAGYAEMNDIPVVSLVVENRHGGENTHNVPMDILDKQADNLNNSIKLR